MRVGNKHASILLAHRALLCRYVAEVQGSPAGEVLRLRLRDPATLWGIDDASDAGDVRISQGEPASMIGASRQTLSGFLATLASRGAIGIAFRRIRILDADLQAANAALRQSL